MQSLANKLQQRVTTLPAAYHYPLVIPTRETSTAFVFTLFIALLGLILIVGGWASQQQHIRQVRLLQTEGVVTRARVTDKTISGDDDSDTYYVHYTFAASSDGDRWVELWRKDRVPEQFYDRVELGGELEVVYVRSDPRIVRIRALYTPGKVEYWSIIISGGLGLLCWLLAWRMFGHYRQAQRLDNEGVTATVRLLDCYKDEDSDGVSYYAAYELPSVGPVRQSIDAQTYARLRPGNPLRLVYLPDRPKTFRVQWE